jgi:uncharacterized glyoxalase superfamily protein PhnB
MRIVSSNPVLAVHDLDRSEIGLHAYVAYPHVDDVDAFYSRAIAAGAEVTKKPTDEPWRQRELGLRSPDGHRFTLGQPIAEPA